MSVNTCKRRGVILQKVSIVKEEWLIVTGFWVVIYRSLGGADPGTKIRISTVANISFFVRRWLIAQHVLGDIKFPITTLRGL